MRHWSCSRAEASKHVTMLGNHGKSSMRVKQSNNFEPPKFILQLVCKKYCGIQQNSSKVMQHQCPKKLFLTATDKEKYGKMSFEFPNLNSERVGIYSLCETFVSPQKNWRRSTHFDKGSHLFFVVLTFCSRIVAQLSNKQIAKHLREENCSTVSR